MACKDTEILRPTGLKVSFHEINNTGTFSANLSWDPLQNNTVEWEGYQLRYIVSGFQDHEFEQNCKQFGKNVTQYTVEYPGMRKSWEFQMVVTSYPFATDPQNKSKHLIRCRVPEDCPKIITTPVASAPSSTSVASTPSSTSVVSTPSPTSVASTPSSTSVVSTPSPTSASPPSSTSVVSTPFPTSDNEVAYYIVPSTAVLVLVLVSVAAYVYRKKGNQKRKNVGEILLLPADLEPVPEYDAFIIFSSVDQKFVDEILLATLEEKHGFKCCIHYRDFDVGVPFINNMAESVRKSRKTIAVMSHNFFSSQFCSGELDLALNQSVQKNDNSVVVIIIDDFDRKNIPTPLIGRSYIDYTNLKDKETFEARLVKCLKTFNNA